MPKAKTVQFRDPGKVIAAYKSRGIAAFAIFQDSALIFPYEEDEEDIEKGAIELSRWLDNLKESAAIYTIRIYRLVPENGITDKTEYNGSFNFRWFSEGDLHYSGGHNPGTRNMIMEKLESMEKRIEELSEDDEDEEPGIGQAAQDGIAQAMPQLIQGIMQTLFPAAPGQQIAQGGTISGIPSDINTALASIRKKCPEFDRYVIRLAQIGETEPVKFQMIVGYMKSM